MRSKLVEPVWTCPGAQGPRGRGLCREGVGPVETDTTKNNLRHSVGGRLKDSLYTGPNPKVYSQNLIFKKSLFIAANVR